MRVIIASGPEEVGRIAAGVIADALERLPAPVIGVATGSSPVAVYEQVGRLAALGVLDLSDARGFALDEYVGMPIDAEQSYARYVRERIEPTLGMRAGSIRVPDGLAADLDAAAQDFEAAILEAGGVDVQLLGIGANGHIGFNEPSSSLSSCTRVKTLAPSTRRDNARFFADEDQVPRLCVTQGLGTIMAARSIVLVAAGAGKAAAVAATVEGPVTSRWPGSVLQFHPSATVVVDMEAAAGLELTEYYRSIEHGVATG